MRFFISWRISSFPELDHLSENERRRLIREHVGIWGAIRMIGWSIVAGCSAGLLVAGVAAGLLSQLPYWMVCLAFAAGVGVLAWQFQLIRIRGQLRMYLEQVAQSRRLPMCLNCGYNIEGLAGNTCPECGTSLPATTQPRPPDA